MSSFTPSAIGRWNALRPEISPIPPARLLITAVRAACAKSLSPLDPPEVVGLARQVGGGVVVLPAGVEGGLPQIAPKHGDHAQLMRHLERFRRLLQLAHPLVGPEIDRRADRHRPQFPRLLHTREHDLVVAVGIGQEFVVVQLDEEGDPVRVPARHGAQHAQRGRDRVAPALHGQLADVPRIEVHRIRRERRPRRVLNALVDRQNRQVAGPGQPSVAQNPLKAAQHLNYILVMLFLKYISDLWNDHVETYRKRYGGNDARIRRRLDRECHIYLISRFASDAGKKAGEFYTPSAVSQLLAKLAAIDRDLDRVLSEWTEALVESLNDPTTTDQMQLLGTQQRQLVGAFLAARVLPGPLSDDFVEAVREVLSGLSKVVLTSDGMRTALASGGLPATLEEMKRRFGRHLAEEAKGLDPAKVRIVLGARK